MATVQLSDIYNPLTFGIEVDEAQIELNNFIASGIMINDAALAAQVGQGGNIAELTGFKPLGTPEPNYSTDNPATASTPQNVTNYVMVARNAQQNQSWSTMDISRELALKEPLPAIVGKIGNYWATTNERRAVQGLLGALADNVANDSSDMVVDVAADAATVLDAHRISAEVVLDAAQTLGDHKASLTGIAMHSVILTRLKKQNLITFIPNARGEITIPTYLGYVVIEDDSLPAVMETNQIKYTCILFGAGALSFASGRVLNASELERDPSSGNGGGQDIIYSRRHDWIHPMGFSFISGSIAGQTPTLAELALAANWNRIWERKHIPIAFLQVND